MKLPEILLGFILMFGAISSVPVDTEENEVIDRDETLSERFVTEVRDYFEEQKGKNSAERNARQISGALNSGDTIALQTYVRNHWLSCSLPSCYRNPCPRMHMSGTDWTNCWGEVFKIYRASGSGQVCVGDLVGLYYTAQANHWLGCTETTCQRSSCPGQPTTAHGFATDEHWYTCCDEVFKIYANGKSSGAVINSGDDIMLYNLEQGRWVAQGEGDATTTTCAGTTRPPPVSKFDECYNETFKIWKKP